MIWNLLKVLPFLALVDTYSIHFGFVAIENNMFSHLLGSQSST